jgi:hypothetical protein
MILAPCNVDDIDNSYYYYVNSDDERSNREKCRESKRCVRGASPVVLGPLYYSHVVSFLLDTYYYYNYFYQE